VIDSLSEERERILDLVLGAITLEEIAVARQALHAWLRSHPEEEGMRHGFEQLSLMEEIAAEQDANRHLSKERIA
jgi:hypothetical protein